MQFMKKSFHRSLQPELLLAVLVVASACSVRPERLPGAASTPPIAPIAALVIAASDAAAPLTESALRNLEYQGIYEEPVILEDGEYAGEPFMEGGASRPMVTLQSSTTGDLDQDRVTDGAVVLAENLGGSGTFIYLAAVVNREAGPRNLSTLLLGDRIRVQSLQIDDGLIRVAAVAHGPQDPLCCPSQTVERLYRLEAGQLTPVKMP